jgi:steroid 5-alpha reductase family enzyme
VIAYNTTLNTINTLVAVNALTSSPYPILGDFTDCIGWKQWAGLALFAIGISMETIAEESRKQFKKDPKNKGKIDDTGLWCVQNHLSLHV